VQEVAKKTAARTFSLRLYHGFILARSGATPRSWEYDETLLRHLRHVFASRESAMTDDLSSLKDDMVAFILGHGMSRFQGYVTEDVHSVMWDPRDNPESWKDFVELAKKAGCAFLSMDEEVLQRDELDYLVQRLQQAAYPSDDDIEEARWLRSFVNKTGFLQLGWPHQGIMFLYEVSTDWYERYQRLLDLVEDFGTLAVDGSDQDEEH
jgi:hypothetical protein